MAPARQQVRIVGGLLKRTPLPLDAQRAGLRPTPERVRATLFDWLGDAILGARVADPYCGTGALGLEALSRGAGEVWLNDLHRGAVSRLQAWLDVRRQAKDARVAEMVGRVHLSVGAALPAMARAAANGRRFDLVLLDPPFDDGDPLDAIEAASALLSNGGAVYVECARRLDEALLQDLSLTVARRGLAGRVHYHLLGEVGG